MRIWLQSPEEVQAPKCVLSHRLIRAWRTSAGKGREAFQFNWSEESMVVGGIFHRMRFSYMKLGASRAFWLATYPSKGHEMLFDAHTRSFAALGGVATHRVAAVLRLVL